MFPYNPNGESGFAKSEDSRLISERPKLGARLLSASPAQWFSTQ